VVCYQPQRGGPERSRSVPVLRLHPLVRPCLGQRRPLQAQ
jgi:hypothetical protein